MRIEQAPTQDTEAAAEPAPAPDLAPDIEAKLDAIVRLLAHQAAREFLERLANPDAEEITSEE